MPTTPEILFYRVTCTERGAESPARRPDGCCLLLLPGESTLAAPDTETEPGRWYRFRSLGLAQWVPLTTEQAQEFRSAGWKVEAPRPARDKAEQALVRHRRKRLDEEKELAARRAAHRQAEVASLKAQRQERVDQLWLVRLFRKTFAHLVPPPWREVRLVYDVRWCEARGIWHDVRNGGCTWFEQESGEVPDGIYSPEFDPIRCIVLGWADGLDKAALDRAVRDWREEFLPLYQKLKPVTNVTPPGRELLHYVSDQIPKARPRLEQILESLPDSPAAIVKLLEDYRPIADAVTHLAELRQSRPLHTVATSEELSALHTLARRGEKLSALLDDAARSLEVSGWSAVNGMLKRRTGEAGRPAHYKNELICGLYAYLWPIYRRSFADESDNPAELRGHMRLLLSPFFAAKEISSARQGPICRAINRFVGSDRGKLFRAEVLRSPAAADLPPVQVGRRQTPPGDS